MLRHIMFIFCNFGLKVANKMYYQTSAINLVDIYHSKIQSEIEIDICILICKHI